MSVSPSYQSFVLEQLARVVTGVRPRRMFGELGVYAGDLFFAIVADDVLYFKTDDATRPEYEARGMEPFRPHGDDRASMSYYQVPEELLEDPDALRPWATAAVEVARRAKRRR